ncbi:bifunctional isocitrate dehydrogenase kinase/phosphatase [Congregibacter litoralis]|uniref:Isocitrate dehydrogenase kinase/phosphatase n=1 Tax=Congregibacter litoralis KT71 TaxID=314285 RepID=A4A5Q7_9GAMM|nr:bifunctional isocitrate dehydrogenase kinase/phosphatase [Congregibacter litoralis]EAQ98354.1 Isocitrate dehydrogenase kinase/phosphatase [Congregibacter litoralis KT71]
MERRERFARIILNGFESYFADFQNITLGARSRFENADWLGIHAATIQRIDLYKLKVNFVLDTVELVAGEELRNYAFWRDTRKIYARLIRNHNNFEIAETFYNSVYNAVFEHEHVRNDYAFVFSSQGDIPLSDSSPVLRYYAVENSLRDTIEKLLVDYRFNIPYEDLSRDVDRLLEAFQEELVLVSDFDINRKDVRMEVLSHHFYRNKGAYIVGRILSGQDSMPFVLPLLHNEDGGVYVDTVLFGSNRVSVVFSFTRTYFMVDATIPSQYVLFLAKLMPAKPISEIYSSMGYNKHGKTYYHRSAVRHMESTTDKFVIAPGIKGMVMTVFTLPSYPFVFKIIKDRFTPPKEVTHEEVKAKYRLVKRADRAGRMADTQEFTNLAFARDRFSDELIEELKQVAPSQIEEHGKALIIGHLYVERRMTPLNLYLQDATDLEVEEVMDEYGNSIKQLAAANIFPGDMLLKNFGVTRHGRVVFYDYDEIVPLTDCNFRIIPEPRNEMEEMASQPWYSVGPNDIFPEEFRLFFSGNQRARKAFDAKHSDIYEARFWQSLQEQIRSGYVESFYPYRRKLRFPREEEPSLLGNT